jgi:hypothetical protein
VSLLEPLLWVTSSGFDNVRLGQVSLTQQTYSKDIPSGPLGAMKPTMVDANNLPPKRPECLSRLAPSRGYLAGISSLQRRNTEPPQHGQR